MAYLLLSEADNILIHKVGESLYLKSYPQKYSQKSTILGRSNYHDYSVSMDESKNIHVVYKSAQNSIIHLKGSDPNFTATTLLEDYQNQYGISNLQLIYLKKNYLFYSALNPYEHTTDLIFHSFTDGKSSAPQSLLALPNANAKYQCFVRDDGIDLLCCVLEDAVYALNLYRYSLATEAWENMGTLIASEFLISDFCFIEHMGGLHIVYVIEKYGHSTLYYAHLIGDLFNSVEIIALGQKIKPILFIYNDVIWVNYLSSLILYSAFSVNNGKSFSQPIKCTLQNNSITEILLLGCKKDNLSGQSFLGFIDQQPNIAVLSQIDVDGILFYSSTNTELREMLKGTLVAPPIPSEPVSHDRVKSLEAEVMHLKELQKSITDQYNNLANFTTEVQFEGKKWRKKYQRLTKELNKKMGTEDREKGNRDGEKNQGDVERGNP